MKSKKESVNRRGFLKGAAASAAALVAGPVARPVEAQEAPAVAMAHGYAKIEGKPIMALLHGTVGTQHGSMAIYNAYADRVPIYVVIGNHMDAAVRPAGVNWYHSAQDMGGLVRDFTKW